MISKNSPCLGVIENAIKSQRIHGNTIEFSKQETNRGTLLSYMTAKNPRTSLVVSFRNTNQGELCLVPEI